MLGKLLHQRSRYFGFEPNIVYVDDNWKVLLASLATFNSVCIMALEYKEFYSDDELVWIPLIDKMDFSQSELPIAQTKNIRKTS